ncbi:hypothetical protein ACFFF5_17985 [Lederbergia wuyishanensis]|uniref:Lipoprotein n=1 Tax=Lederbergia wuyishanensis TaxID=1347903 RepID=A0ABU0D4K0_9BACI|nr:hypothetical protein [Lederbergia wuyishanensis]MCJ8008083.1 hypothetical protein [Lederbergia wuyishanensis]MDQ0343332.1 hypothetical protein [Lederbergia wuyishanensis]
MKRIISMMFVCLIVLSGCSESSDFYSGIENDILNDINTEYHEYKGHSDNWAAVYIVYKAKDKDKYSTKLYTKYIGKKPNPTGKISYNYDLGSDVGNGAAYFKDVPEKGIYYLGSIASNESISTKDTKVKLQIEWNKKSETIDLKSK